MSDNTDRNTSSIIPSNILEDGIAGNANLNMKRETKNCDNDDCDKSATIGCLNCEQNFCSNCDSILHKNKKNKNHQKCKVKNNYESIACEIHKIDKTYFCTDHKILICSECVNITHQKCPVILYNSPTMEEYIKDCRKKYSEKLSELKDQSLVNTEIKTKITEANLPLKDKIIFAFKERIKLLLEVQNIILNDVDAIHDKHMKEIYEKIQLVETEQQKIQDILTINDNAYFLLAMTKNIRMDSTDLSLNKLIKDFELMTCSFEDFYVVMTDGLKDFVLSKQNKPIKIYILYFYGLKKLKLKLTRLVKSI